MNLPKTVSTRRLVYLPPGVLAVIGTHRSWQRENASTLVNVVFPSREGTYRYPTVLVKPLQRCCERAGVAKRLTAHCMRKTANNLIRRAAGDTVARSMIGHATAEMTLRYSEVDQAEALGALHAAFGRSLSPACAPAANPQPEHELTAAVLRRSVGDNRTVTIEAQRGGQLQRPGPAASDADVESPETMNPGQTLGAGQLGLWDLGVDRAPIQQAVTRRNA